MAEDPGAAQPEPVRSEHTGSFLRLSQLWRRRNHFSLVFATVDAADYREALIRLLNEHPPGARIDFTPDTTPAQWLAALADAKAQGLERVHVCLPLEARRHDGWWQQANVLRERLAEAFAGVQLLWLMDADVDAAAHQATDLWNWREAVLPFTAVARPLQAPEVFAHRFDQRTDQEAQAVVQRLHSIERYLEQRHADDPGLTSAHLLLEAAQAYLRTGQWEQSLLAGQKAKQLFEAQGDAAHAAQALAHCAELLSRTGRPQEALALLREQVLPVYETLGLLREAQITRERLAADNPPQPPTGEAT